MSIAEQTARNIYEVHLRQRAMNAYIDILEGKYSTAEEMESRLEAKYPWLCE